MGGHKGFSGPGSAWWSNGKQPSEPVSIVRYGPKDCVSTYRSAQGHCIMQTQCLQKDIANYSFGLVCVDSIGVPVRHLFGRGSLMPVGGAVHATRTERNKKL